MPTYKMTLEYDGTHFVGWQVQNNGRSVQHVLEKALYTVTQENIRIVGAGRTDSGVHARGQVASFKVTNPLNPQQISKSLNAILPNDVVVRSLEEVEDTFHARYSAKARVYEYTIVRRPIAIGRLYAWELFYILNTEALNTCAAMIVGTHDFRSFCKKDTPRKNTFCSILRAEWHEINEYLRFVITANRFLHGMVRALVGSMVDVARGAMTRDEFHALLYSNSTVTTPAMYAPAKGLCLLEVLY
ncbi:MAG: tRNA pseudouridine(38-40) synthase TruA [Bacteroidetes bacterium]|nr:tRNA pseudouridine(38-40) synthase TruA [Bacteroidota bacterium]